MKLLLATQNPGKQKEMQELLKDVDVQVLLPTNENDVEETGTTFEENARLKSSALFQLQPDMFVVADDSGLAVDALNGRPGVYSKRYGVSDKDRIEKLLAELITVPEEKRSAKFVCVLSLLGPGIDEVFTGEVQGKIAFQAQGEHGFGYDPIFVPDGYDRTFSQLGKEVKNTVSHRAKALEKLKVFLKNL